VVEGGGCGVKARSLLRPTRFPEALPFVILGLDRA
jgi:hypothetical protein